MYPIYGAYNTKTKLQIKNLFSIRQHSYPVTFEGNSFIANSVIKGLIYIDTVIVDTTVSYPYIQISNNYFEQNMGYYGTSAVYIRGNIDNFSTTTLDTTIIPCGGILISSNTFLNNFGC